MAKGTGTKDKENTTVKAETTTKKAATRKTASPVGKSEAKTTGRGKLNKGDTLACEVCGLSVVVDECGDVAAQEILCCSQAMKPKARRTRTAAKK